MGPAGVARNQHLWPGNAETVTVRATVSGWPSDDKAGATSRVPV